MSSHYLNNQTEHYTKLLGTLRAVNTTRLIFLLAGFSMAAWAPIVPLIKDKLTLSDDILGLLLISLAVGSLAMMPLAAFLIEKLSCKKVICLGFLVVSLTLPLLMFAPNLIFMLAVLFCFGAGLGLVDIAMNTQAVLLEKASPKPIMSSMHAFWSIGGVIGSTIVTTLLGIKIDPLLTLLIAVILIIFAFVPFIKNLLPKQIEPLDENGQIKPTEKTPFIVLPKGIVLLIGILCFILFLAEGAMLDWSAIYLNQFRDVPLNISGSGFIVFSIAMTVGRLTGDWVVASLGRFKVLFWGALLSALGYLLLIVVPIHFVSFIGITLIGIGASNAVPILFTAAGNQKEMPAHLAIAAVAMVGYGGMLIGPAAIGFISNQIGLDKAFFLISSLLLIVVLCSKKVTSTVTKNE
ncbi:MFS transporter [Thorsellia anophelis]|uniref:Fucose permease n=1 Tax=Thorsellia anophelis DSM 18579 TaxID=1123402 RepID=A0A1H9ZXM3_9GAMM|nr:MFS transporter [Thorsellia anophelis]SES86087.1 Fucose permease [Thorsellia anophelis DSM 18579]